MTDTLHSLLGQATATELGRLSDHLSLAADSEAIDIEKAYRNAADNTVLEMARPVIKSKPPSYSDILRLIYRKLRPYTESLDDHWSKAKSIKFWQYTSPVDEMADEELAVRILELYKAEFLDLDELAGGADAPERESSFRWGIAKWIPGMSGTAASRAAILEHAAFKLPFVGAAVGAARGAVAGPVGMAAVIVLMGFQLSGPAFRKIIPATVELMLIGQRIAHTPQE